MASSQPGWALVTGASSGLGAEFAQQLARRGHGLVLVARRRDRLEQLAGEIAREGGRAPVVIDTDLTAAGAPGALVRELDARGIVVDLLVNNAGMGSHGLVVELPIERASAMIRLNVLALTELSIAVGAKMVARRSGTIVNVSSTASFQPCPHFAVYGATKAYVTSFSLALAEELRPYGVRVLAHCPGPTRTEFFDVNELRSDVGDWAFMDAPTCVASALRALARGRSLVVTGALNALGAAVARHAPLALSTFVAGRLLTPSRPAKPRSGAP